MIRATTTPAPAATAVPMPTAPTAPPSPSPPTTATTPSTTRFGRDHVDLGVRPYTFRQTGTREVVFPHPHRPGGGAPPELHAVYEVRVGDHGFELSFPQGYDAQAVIARVVALYRHTPVHLRHAVKSIQINDAPGKGSLALGGNGAITFFDGLANVRQSVFDHEFGHNIAEIWDPAHRTPPGWREAVAADGDNFPTEYGRRTVRSANPHYDEDFADAWAAYMTARLNDTLPAFASTYPNRFAVLERIYHGAHPAPIAIPTPTAVPAEAPPSRPGPVEQFLAWLGARLGR